MFSDKLNEALTITGIKAIDLARLTDISRGQISNYLNGKREPKAETIANIAQALGVSCDFLLGLSDDLTPAIGKNNLKDKELEVITLWRRKDFIQAATIILQDKDT